MTEPATAAEHWSGTEAALLDPAQELETIELGDRVAWWLTMWSCAAGYAKQTDRERAAITTMVGEVAEATSHRGLPYPPEWWPADLAPLEPAPAD